MFSSFQRFYIVLISGVMRLTSNVAPRGNATQSTDYIDARFVRSPLVASYANDENFDQDLVPASGACAHTKNTPPVWWQVDLLEVYEITKVAISGRKQYRK